jgi:hypothetical protein
LPFVARIILVSRESVKPDFHFMINWLKRCGILVVGLLGWGGFPERACCGHKKTGAWPVLLFLFAGGSEEKCLERVAGIEPLLVKTPRKRVCV